jgi:hypothetical protein
MDPLQPREIATAFTGAFGKCLPLQRNDAGDAWLPIPEVGIVLLTARGLAGADVFGGRVTCVTFNADYALMLQQHLRAGGEMDAVSPDAFDLVLLGHPDDWMSK